MPYDSVDGSLRAVRRSLILTLAPSRHLRFLVSGSTHHRPILKHDTRNRLTLPRSGSLTFQCRTIVSPHRTKDLIDPPLAATRNADREQASLFTLD
jgi:hypothetical protein